MEKTDTLSKMLNDLAKQGYVPSIYRRGDLWRAHVNMAGNFWEDASTPLKALRAAIKLWEKAGKPVDGMAAEARVSG